MRNNRANSQKYEVEHVKIGEPTETQLVVYSLGRVVLTVCKKVVLSLKAPTAPIKLMEKRVRPQRIRMIAGARNTCWSSLVSGRCVSA